MREMAWAALVLIGLGAAPLGASEPVPSTAPASLESVPDTLLAIDELERLVGPEGDRARGMEAIRVHASRRASQGATLWLQLLAVVERVDPRMGALAVRAVGLGEEGRGVDAAALLVEALEVAGPEDGPPLLALATLLAEMEDGERAGELRARFIEEHPEAFEAAEIQFRQARWMLAGDELMQEGLDLLEELIVDRPNHPVAPEARRLYQQERTRIPTVLPEEDPS